MALRPLPQPMLARTGRFPTSSGWAFEVKWDGFRCLVSTEDGFRARSRRGWRMTEQLLELADLPVRGVFDGELVAFGDDGRPDFDLVCRRLLHGDEKIQLAYLIFDVLALRGRTLLDQPYRERRGRLGRCDFKGVAHAPEAFDDGDASWEAVCDQRLEGVVAKRLDER